MRHESLRPRGSKAYRLGIRPLRTLRLLPATQIPEKVVPGSPSRRSKTAGESSSGPRVASGGGASLVVSAPLEEETRVPSSKSPDFVVEPVSWDPVSLLQDVISNERKTSEAATRAFAVAR